RNWISGVVFFNLTHIAFTFKNILYSSEYRQLFRESNFTLRRHLTILFGLFFVFLFLDNNSVFKVDGVSVLLFAVICNWIRALHSIRQSLGISLLYNQRLVHAIPTPSTLTAEAKARRYEHWACLALGAGYCLRLTGLHIESIQSSTLVNSLCYFSFALSLILYIKSLWQIARRDFFAIKALFLARLTPWFLFDTSGFTIFVTQAVHGIEYLFIESRVHKKSSNLKKIVPQSLIFVAVFSLVFLYCIGQFRFGAFPGFAPDIDSKPLQSIALCIGLALNYYHFYLDYWIFKMKSPPNRRLIGPLLAS
ncbi:MAG: hypothetical protein JNJ49_14220, partial [Bdellovibrionaceae bacterium]|nr:hypothetical protein [Pseudobdellovibrionaceae bacterium]